MPKADGSPTQPEMAAGYMVGRVAVGKRPKLWAWFCLACGEGACEDGGQATAHHKAVSHRCG